MRNLITAFALLVSLTGVFVSLAREELRCKLGLNSEECAKALQKTEPIPDAIAPGSKNVATPPRRSQVSTSEEMPDQKAIQVLESPPQTELSTTNKMTQGEDKTTDITGQKMLKPTEEKAVPELPTTDQATSINPEIPAHESSQMDTSNNSENDQNSGNVAPNAEPIPVIAPPLLQPKSE
ncbi:MAG: hypothetical protein ACRC6M_07935 [Microcystaceae cyanobacterium]